jgi:hypothetical protein
MTTAWCRTPWAARYLTRLTKPKSFWTVHGARHLNIVPVAGPRYAARLREFYASLGLRDSRAAVT